MNCFETGPIRPPSEAGSILLRLTRNCHWNRCAFCPVYKRERFSVRKVDEVKGDIDAMSAIAGRICGRVGGHRGGRGMREAIVEAVRGLDLGDGEHRECVRQVAFWLAQGMRNMFLQDADALVLRTEQLVEILRYARATFPTIERITTYARAKTISRKSPDELKALRAAGLNRIHIGMESGSDAVLSLVQKGVTQDEQIRAGRNVMAAGIELSEYFMPGLGGRELSDQHAVDSAAVLSAVNPTFIRLRSTVPVPGTPLHDMMAEGRWAPLTEEEKVREIRLCIERIEGVTSTVQSDHIMNLLEGVAGTLPDGKRQILELIDRFLDMDPADREAFIVGRRAGRYRDLSDYVPANEVEMIRRDLVARFGSVERGILEILPSFV
ncbi:MAG TPA: radical SAM protein [Verrucomicrobiae bacterium]|nr:radical SAM protein [Verrucomicrobiae bacterium]